MNTEHTPQGSTVAAISAMVGEVSREVDEARKLLDESIRKRDALLWALHSRGFGTHQRLSDWTKQGGATKGVTAQTVRLAIDNAPNKCTSNDFDGALERINSLQDQNSGISVGRTLPTSVPDQGTPQLGANFSAN